MKYRFLCKNNLGSKFFQISSHLLFTMAICLGMTLSISAQTGQSMPCEGQLNVSLNSECKYGVNPSNVLTTQNVDDNLYDIMLEDKKGNPIVDDTLRFEHLGQNITVKVIEKSNTTTNSCWGTIFVEDKKPPTLTCKADTVSCFQMDAYLPEATDNCDSDVKIIQIGGTTTLADCGAKNGFLKTIMRTYVAEDNQGFQSDTCTQTINILRIDTSDILVSKLKDFIGDDAFNCNGDYPKDEQGHPHPDTSGILMYTIRNTKGFALDVVPIWPDINSQCKARVTYDDTVLGEGGPKERIMRRWTFFDACSSADPFTHIQMIYVKDTEPPVIDCPTNLTLIGNTVNSTINSHYGTTDCELAINVPAAPFSDNCSDNFKIRVELDGVIVLGSNGGSIIASPGVDTIEYFVSDGKNESSCKTEITVLDNSPPIAICDKHSVIGLSLNGEVEVQASVFDDGSLDACGIDTMKVKRIGTVCDDADLEFGPTITLCCMDVDAENFVKAVFRVYDNTGAFSDCEVQIEVQDKSPVSAVCPDPETINCDHPLDLTDLSQFGDATSNNECGEGLREIDPIVEINSCNNGHIIRQWESISSGLVSCTQTISLAPSVDFEIANLDDIISKPRDIDTTGACGVSLDPENLPPGAQRPEVLGENTCDLIGTSHKDEIFRFDDGTNACMKILRTWTILNWCAPEDKNSLQWTQSIKVNDTDKPVVTLDPMNQDTVCSLTDDCENANFSFIAYASDTCTDSLSHSILIDIGNDGEDIETTFGVAEQRDSLTYVTFSSTLPLGTHRIQFSFRDDCGLITTRDHIFTLKNCKAPSCKLYSLRANVGVGIWASDFDSLSTANCPLGEPLTYFFDSLKQVSEISYSIESLENMTSKSFDVPVYIFDQFNNRSSCITSVTIDDKADGLVGGNDTQTISGLVSNHNGGNVPDAMVELRNTEYAHKMSDNTGEYAFSHIESNKQYTVQVGKDDDHMNGVSTLDLVLIQKHILGIEILDDPYQMIAADINKSGNVSAIDLVELRKLILGEQNSFSSNTSWRFVDKTYEFLNAANPLNENFPEEYEISNLSNDMKVDFVGIKVGDVSGNASFENFLVSETRSSKKLKLFQEKKLRDGSNIMEFEISAEEFSQVDGFQTTFSYDASVLKYIGVEEGAIKVTSSHIGKNFADKGLITLSWSSAEEVTLSDKLLFKFIFQVNGEVSQGLKINSQITSTEVYYDGKVSTNIVLRDKFENLLIDQNVPNPWFDQTEISFQLTNAAEVKLTVYDLFGKQIHVESLYSNEGDNKVTLDRTDIPSTGVYFYELASGSQKVINKMIVIE